MKKIVIHTILLIVFIPLAGAAWQETHVPGSANLNGMHILSADDIWVVGGSGTLFHFDGMAWNPMDTGVTATLNNIAMVDSEEGWLVGEDGTILHYHDGIFEKIPDMDDQVGFEDVLVIDRDNVVIIGYGFLAKGQIFRWDGTALTLELATSGKLKRIDGDAPDNIWIVGDKNYRAFYDGNSWTEYTDMLNEDTKLFGVCIDEDGYPLICGMRLPKWDLAKIYKYDGQNWNTEYSDYAPWLLDIDSYETAGLLVGKEGVIVRRTIFGWEKISRPTTSQINDIEFLDMSRAWAACDNGIVLSYMNPAVDIQLNRHTAHAGDRVELKMLLQNPGETVNADVFLMLEAYGYFYFWPTWTTDVDFTPRQLESNTFTEDVIFDFNWPDAAGNGIATFWGALLVDNELVNYDTEVLEWF